MRRSACIWVLPVILVIAALLPPTALAQSAIAGVVRDPTGSVLPGVTVEAASPVLIEKVRTATTDGAGVYRLIDLRPGVYTVTVTLPGFNTFVREGLELPADFTAPLNVELRVGGLEETVTVSGASPVVDVQSVTRREAMSRDLIDALPTGRNFQTAGATLPSVSMGRFDVGGSSTMQTNNQLVAAGSRADDTTEEVDGMGINSSLGSSSNVPVYLNNAVYEEQVYTLVGGGADVQTPGVRVNLIPKSGGNTFHGTAVGIFANTDFQAVNISPAEAARQGQTSAARLSKVWDYNAALGGRLVRDRLWFFGSVPQLGLQQPCRKCAPEGWHAGGGHQPAGSLQPAADVAAVTETQGDGDVRQVPQVSRAPEHRNRHLRARGHLHPTGAARLQRAGEVERHADEPAARRSGVVDELLQLLAAVSARGRGVHGEPDGCDLESGPQHEPDLRRRPLRFNSYFDRDYVVSSATYATGSHSFRMGEQFSTGWVINKQFANGDLFEQYRGIPGRRYSDARDGVHTPTFNRTDLDADLGVYVQDTWKLNRVTITPGLRYDLMRQSVAPTSMPAGRFVPARSFAEIPRVADWGTWSPRFGIAWDVFGTGKTALRFSSGKYMERDATQFASNYNPSTLSTDVRTWNGARDAQGLPDQPRPLDQQQLRHPRREHASPRHPASVPDRLQLVGPAGGGAAHLGGRERLYPQVPPTSRAPSIRSCRRAPSSCARFADPRGNGEMIPVYDIQSQWLGQLNQNLQTVSSDINSRSYIGYDVLVNSRLSNGATINGGVSVGKFAVNTCDVFNPERPALLRHRAVRHSRGSRRSRPAVSITLPYGVRVSGVLQSALFAYQDTYLVNRTVVSSLVLPSVTVQLDPRTRLLPARHADRPWPREDVQGTARPRSFRRSSSST